MKFFKNLSIAALFTLVTAVIADDAAAAEDSKVHVLTQSNFEEFLTTNPLALVEFYAPWCGHCKALAPEYEQAAANLVEHKLPLAKVDCTTEADLCSKQEVQGYPTLKVFRGPTTSTPYSGARKAAAIESFMIKQSLPAVSILESENVEEFKTKDKVVIITYLKGDDKASNETITAVAEDLRNDFLFGATHDAAVAEKEGVKAPAVVLYKNYDEPKTVYEGEFSKDEITKFIKVTSVPLIGEVGPDTYQGYMSAGIPLAYLFIEQGDKNKEKLVEAITDIAKEFKGKINFATIDATAFGAHAPNLNLEQKWPAFAIQETTKNAKFPFDQSKEISKASIEEFVRDFAAGKISPSIKSEEIPTSQPGPVHVVVAKNYQDIVMDNDKDVLLEFYAPWCGHCKALAPKYEELGKLFFEHPEYKDKVIIAKVDATANDVPDDIAGFPTIKLFPAKAKDSPIDYAGSRTVEDFLNFIKENGYYKADVQPPKPAETESSSSSTQNVAEKATEAVKSAAEAASSAVADEDVHDEL